MKKYTVNVHYDYVATVEVEAENEDDALELAENQADMMPVDELEYCETIDSCVTDEVEI